MSVGLSRAERKEETRRALIEAAAGAIARKGVEGTSLVEIAGSLGLTKGAVYAHFPNKDALIDAVSAAYSRNIALDTLYAPDLPLEESFARLGRELWRILRDLSNEQALLFLELILYDLRRPEVAAQRRDRKGDRAEGKRIDEAVAARGEQLTLTGLEVLYALSAMAMGFFVQSKQDPKSYSEAMMAEAFAVFGRGLVDQRRPK